MSAISEARVRSRRQAAKRSCEAKLRDGSRVARPTASLVLFSRRKPNPGCKARHRRVTIAVCAHNITSPQWCANVIQGPPLSRRFDMFCSGWIDHPTFPRAAAPRTLDFRHPHHSTTLAGMSLVEYHQLLLECVHSVRNGPARAADRACLAVPYSMMFIAAGLAVMLVIGAGSTLRTAAHAWRTWRNRRVWRQQRGPPFCVFLGSKLRCSSA